MGWMAKPYWAAARAAVTLRAKGPGDARARERKRLEMVDALDLPPRERALVVEGTAARILGLAGGQG